MNVICGFIEAITATIELIGMGVGNLSIIWSWLSGSLHCAEGLLLNPALSTLCGPIIGGGGAGLISGGVNFLGHILTQGLGEACNTVLHIIVSVLPM